MFCSKCHREVFYNNLEYHGWCDRCKSVVEVSPCALSHWCVAAVMLMPWLISSATGTL
jgi:hypothetical protein